VNPNPPVGPILDSTLLLSIAQIVSAVVGDL